MRLGALALHTAIMVAPFLLLLRQDLPVVSRLALNSWTSTALLPQFLKYLGPQTCNTAPACPPYCPRCGIKSLLTLSLLIVQLWRRLVEIDFPRKYGWKGSLLGDLEGRLKQVPETGALFLGDETTQRRPGSLPPQLLCVVHLSARMIMEGRHGFSPDAGHVL